MEQNINKEVPDSDNSVEARIYNYIEGIARHPKNAENKLEDIKKMLEKIPEDERLNVLLKGARERSGETVLHTAIKLFSGKSKVDEELIEYFAMDFPKLILQDRVETKYAGQTPLHMAVCKGNLWIVKALLRKLSIKKNKHMKTALFKKKAYGAIFQNTVMMGELPLIIAALTFNKGIFDLLLDKGADLDDTNTDGECVSHSLIRYAFLYPEKLDDVIKMCRYISKDPEPNETSGKVAKIRKLRKKIWLMENCEGLNPLQLSAKLGQHELFGFIINLEVYCFENSKDGLFDLQIYDVTDIDAIASMKTEDVTGSDEIALKTESLVENVPVRRTTITQPKPCTDSILMMMLELKPFTAFQFLQFPPMRRTIDRKWDFYQMAFYPWWIIHFLFVCFLTWYSVERAQQNFNNGTQFDVNSKPNFKTEITKNGFVTAFGAVTLLVSALYLAQEILRLIKGQMPLTLNSFQNPYCNSWFRLLFVLLALALVVDFILAIASEYYENFCLIVAVVMGWFSIIFFLRVVRSFSFVTVLIQNVLFGDMFRFFVIIIIELIAFSTAMYMVIQGSDVISSTDFSNFARVVFSMFKLMVGLGESAALYDTRHPAIAIIIFVGFIIMTTLLMLNALIAIMSRTCKQLVENVGDINARDRHWQLQRLSVILFIESILPQRMIFRVGNETEMVRYNNRIRRRKKLKRYMLEIRSLHKKPDDKAGIVLNWGLLRNVLKSLTLRQGLALGDTERPQSGLNNKQYSKGKRKLRGAVKRSGSRVAAEKETVVNEHFMADEGVQNQILTQAKDGVDYRQSPRVLEIYSVAKCDGCSYISPASTQR